VTGTASLRDAAVTPTREGRRQAVGKAHRVAPQWRRKYLLDVWVERRLFDSFPAIVRGRLHDLSTAEERYVGSFDEVIAGIEADLDADGITPRRWERERGA
jgi:hypothetical protein